MVASSCLREIYVYRNSSYISDTVSINKSWCPTISFCDRPLPEGQGIIVFLQTKVGVLLETTSFL